MQACICPETKAVFSIHCAEAQFEFRVKDSSLPVMCYPVMSSENLVKPPCFSLVEFKPDP